MAMPELPIDIALAKLLLNHRDGLVTHRWMVAVQQAVLVKLCSASLLRQESMQERCQMCSLTTTLA
jgi:hypothetical protein